MNALSIKKDSNLSDLERAFKSISENPNITLRLPNSLTDRGVFGIEGLVALLVATWIRKNSKAHILHTYAAGNEPRDFEGLGSTFFGISALRLCDKIWTVDKKVVDKGTALESSFSRVRKVIDKNFEDAFKGFYVAIPSIRASGDKNREFNSPFYREKKVIGLKGFREIVSTALKKVVPQKKRSEVIDPTIDNVSEIVRELFENAHKYSREDEKGNVLADNFRCVIFNSVDIDLKRLEKIASGGNKGVIGFTAEWTKWMRDTGKKLPVLDITVVDSGPGYARRWTGSSAEKLTLQDEKNAVVGCFTKNQSSGAKPSEGSGLTHVLTDLRELRGWFRLRTGSISVSRSFFDGKGAITIADKDIHAEASFIDGVSFNLVIPLVTISSED